MEPQMEQNNAIEFSRKLSRVESFSKEERIEEDALLGENSFRRFPKVSLMEMMSSKYALRFKLWDTDVSMANSLRRIMMVEVPTVAIDLVEITANSSVLQDEFIAHRLGLILLSASQGAMAMLLPEECPCESESRALRVQETMPLVMENAQLCGQVLRNSLKLSSLRKTKTAGKSVMALMSSKIEGYSEMYSTNIEFDDAFR